MKNPKCKICRRAGVKLFLKGEKCLSPKCPLVVKPYPPGFQGKRRRSFLSEYGIQLKEKQKLKNWYNLREGKLKRYVKLALGYSGKEDAQDILFRELEKRLDNVVSRLGLASSHSEARQLVSHNHFLVNKQKVNIPSYKVKIGDVISVSGSSSKTRLFQEKIPQLEAQTAPAWLKFEPKKLEATVVSEPLLEEVSLPADISRIFEWYSR